MDLWNLSKMIFYTFSWPSHPVNCISLGSFIGFVLVISKLYVTNVFNIPIILLLLSTFPANKPHSIFVQRKNIIQNILRRNWELQRKNRFMFYITTLSVCFAIFYWVRIWTSIPRKKDWALSVSSMFSIPSSSRLGFNSECICTICDIMYNYVLISKILCNCWRLIWEIFANKSKRW